MHRRLQSGMRENPASNRRQGSRLVVGSTQYSNYAEGSDSDRSSLTAQNESRNRFPECRTLRGHRRRERTQHGHEAYTIADSGLVALLTIRSTPAAAPSKGTIRLTGSKIIALVLECVEDSVVRSDSRGFGVAGSFSQCAFVSIVC